MNIKKSYIVFHYGDLESFSITVMVDDRKMPDLGTWKIKNECMTAGEWGGGGRGWSEIAKSQKQTVPVGELSKAAQEKHSGKSVKKTDVLFAQIG